MTTCHYPAMSKPRNPSRELRRLAALSATRDTIPQIVGLAYILRLGTGPSIWLKGEVPFVAWGPRDQAMKFGTRHEASAAVKRLSNHGKLAVEEIGG